MTDIVKLYNPANAASLAPEQIAGLQNLTSEQIKTLAVAYPNMTMNRAYLLIVDSKIDPSKQLPRLSTFENLWNLREKNAQRQYVAYAFKGAYKPNAVSVPRKTKVLDLSETELMSLPGFKTAGSSAPAAKSAPKKEVVETKPQAVKLTRVRKSKI